MGKIIEDGTEMTLKALKAPGMGLADLCHLLWLQANWALTMHSLWGSCAYNLKTGDSAVSQVKIYKVLDAHAPWKCAHLQGKRVLAINCEVEPSRPKPMQLCHKCSIGMGDADDINQPIIRLSGREDVTFRCIW